MLSTLLKQEALLPHDSSGSPASPNYKQLYEQCKHNVAVFMKQVDQQITKILNTHAIEKRKLQRQIDRLKSQLNQPSHNNFNYSRNSSVKSFNPNRSTYQPRDKSCSSLSKETVEECLTKFSTLEVSHRPSFRDSQQSFEITMHGKNPSIDSKNSSIDKKRSVKERDWEKQNANFSSNSFKDFGLSLKPLEPVSNNGVRRQKRFKQKKGQEVGGKPEDIKDLLKDMRGRVNSNGSAYWREKQEENKAMVSIISPELFSARSKAA